MSEELLQRGLLVETEKIGRWDFYRIGATSVKALKENGIIHYRDYGDAEKKKVDGLIVQGKNVIAVLEYKKPSEFNTKAKHNKAVKQEIEVAKKLGSKIFIATDTQESVWVNALNGERIKDENGTEIKTNFDPKDEKIVELIEKINYSINDNNSQIKPKRLVNPTGLAKQIWQDIWTVSGEKPEICLYTFVELFIFKYLSDLGVLEGIFSFNDLISNFETNTPEEILENYVNNIRPKIKKLFPEHSVDKTTIINGTIFVSSEQTAVQGYSTVFKKVLLRFRDYGKLEHIDFDFKSQLFESFLKESISKKNWGQFFTPLKVIRAIGKMAKDEIKEGAKICDPACGVGKFLLEPIATNLDYFYDVSSSGIKPKIFIHGFDKGFAKDEQKTIILAKANMLIYFSDLIKQYPKLTKEFAELFNASFTLVTTSILGTLSQPTENEYDLILTNPPYVTSGSSNLKDEIKKDGRLSNYFKTNALGIEGLFMEWIIRALKPNGKAYVVIPDGILNRQHDKHLRQFILDECFIDGIVSLPTKTFFNTPKKTFILCLTKKANKKEIQTEPVFTYLVSEIGETRDIYRFDIDQNDLEEAVNLYSFFKGGAKANFAKINPDKRCKIIPIETFASTVENSWIIDNFWSKEEKIDLGVIGDNQSIKIDELPFLLENISKNIQSLQKDVLDLTEKKTPELTFKEIKIADILDFPQTNSKITKTYCATNVGEIPVYASSKSDTSVIGTIKDNIKGVKYFGNCLSWNRNGSVGYVFIRNHRFTTNEDHRPMIIKPIYEDSLDKLFLKYEIEKRLFENGFSFLNKCGVDKIKGVTIKVPIDTSGNFDLEKQKFAIEKYEYIDDINKKVKAFQKQIRELNIQIEESATFITVHLEDIFEVQKGKAAYTNKYIVENRGEFPVYSSQTTDDGIIGTINSYDYDKNCLTWTTDGIYAGTVFLRNGKFSMTTHCGALLLKKDVKDISLEYIHYQLEQTLRNFAEGDQNKRVTANTIKTVPVKIPVTSIGEFDLQTQTEIAAKSKKIKDIKAAIIQELDRISEVNIQID